LRATDDLAAGRLVRPFGKAMPVDFSIYVVIPPALVTAPKVKAFRDWLFEEAAEPAHATEKPSRSKRK
jgi:LysR family glycine cleavage system transcriptional activator